MHAVDLVGVAICLSAAAATGLGASRLVPAASASTPTASVAPDAAQPDLRAMLLEGLRETPGCLGSDAAVWESGKVSIVGWFESKAAVLAWYDSQLHRRLMTPMGGATAQPLEHIPDDQGPMVVFASITPADEPAIQGFPAPISQISIEQFAPLPGGAHINGRLAPDGFTVEHLRDLAEAAPGAPAPAR